jgi:hypothetical protein
VVPGADYLDAIFTAIRAFSDELAASKRWLSRAEDTSSQAWRLAFLHEARASFERAPAKLSAIAERLAELGPEGSLPPPLNRIQENLTTMRGELDAHGARLSRAEEAEGNRAVGRA